MPTGRGLVRSALPPSPFSCLYCQSLPRSRRGFYSSAAPSLSLGRHLLGRCRSNRPSSLHVGPGISAVVITEGESNTTINSVQKGFCHVTVCPLDLLKLVHIFHRRQFLAIHNIQVIYIKQTIVPCIILSLRNGGHSTTTAI